MKKTYIFLSLILFTFAFISCEKDDPKTTITDVTPSVLSNLSSSDFVLTLDDASKEFQTFEWTNADYGFSASVTYAVQFAAKDSNFSNPMVIGSVNHGNSISISTGDFNKMLLNYGLNPDEATTLQFRVAAVVSANYAPAYSNTVEANVTPYATDFPPIYMCGAATGGWDWAHGVEVRSSAPSVYHTIAYFLNGETFRFFKQADWGPTSYNYPYFNGGFVSDSLENAADGDQNFRFLAPTGYYDITCNLKAKIVTLKPVAEPMMFMTGAALGGWDWATNYVQMTWIRDGVFEATTDFLNGETFRFFAQKDWSPVSYNYPFFPAGNVDPLFENANDGDKNFRFIGTTGSYKITLNMLDNTVVMEAQ